MSALTKLLGFACFAMGALALTAGFNEAAGAEQLFVSLAPGLMIGGLVLMVLGEIAGDVRKIRQIADAQASRPN